LRDSEKCAHVLQESSITKECDTYAQILAVSVLKTCANLSPLPPQMNQ